MVKKRNRLREKEENNRLMAADLRRLANKPAYQNIRLTLLEAANALSRNGPPERKTRGPKA